MCGDVRNKANSTVFYTVLKFALFGYACIFWLIGIIILVIGIYAEIERLRFKTLDGMFLAPSIILILLGIGMTVVSFIGIMGSLRDNITFLKLFMYALTICLLLQLLGGVLALAFRNTTRNLVNKNIKAGIKNYYDDLDFKNILDFVQKRFYCCGGESFTDWKDNIYHNCTGLGPLSCAVPYTCCVVKPNEAVNTLCGYQMLKETPLDASHTIHIRGCTNAFLLWMTDNYTKMGAFLLVIFMLQFFGIIASWQYKNLVEEIGCTEYERANNTQGCLCKWFACMPE